MAADEKLSILNREQLKEIAKDLVAGRIFGSWMIKPGDKHLVRSIFMPLMFMDSIPENVGHTYEHYDQAGPRSINGYPVFMSCRMIAEENLEELRELIDKMQGAMDSV